MTKRTIYTLLLTLILLASATSMNAQWQRNSRKTPPNSPGATALKANEVQTFVDTRDNEKYLYRSFGTSAGTWMLENMRYLDPNFSASDSTDPSHLRYLRLQRVFYPQPGNPGNILDPSQIPTWDKKQGYLYSYAAATMGKWDKSDEDTGNDPREHIDTPTQGICPKGWHIPTDYEWSLLEQELAQHPQNYGDAKQATAWTPRKPQSVSFGVNDDFERGSWRPENANTGHAATMKSKTPVSRAPATGGKSYTAAQGGFDALFVGNRLDDQTANYGGVAVFYTASTYGPVNAWFRIISSQSEGVFRGYYSRASLLSVRCKRDVN